MIGQNFSRIIQAAAHGISFALIFLGAQAVLVGQKHPLNAAAGCLLGLGVLAACADGWWAGLRGVGRTWGWRLGGWLLAAGLGLIWARDWSSVGAWHWVLGAGFIFVAGLQKLIRTAAGAETASVWAETFRWVMLPVAACWLFRPFFESEFFGAVDARSYGYTMVDALLQSRAGVFPVLVGQSEFMFNGAIHPIRTAPYHHYLGIALDLITFRELSPLAIQHLTVVVTAAQAALMGYACLVWVAPHRRWLAWVFAMLFVSSPAVGGYVYGQEMYMTFMTFGWLPLVLAGNVRLLRQDDRMGWLWLVAGLALVWVAHAPVALWLTIATAGLQFLRLFTRDFTASSWRRAGGGAVGLVGLLAYYFWSVAEVSQSGGGVAGVAAFGAFVSGVGLTIRFMASGRWGWWVAAGCVTGGLAVMGKLYFAWLAGTVGLSAAIVGLAPKRSKALAIVRDHLPESISVLVLLAGLVTAHWRPAFEAMPAYAWVARAFPLNLAPMTAYAQQLTDLQLGYGLWVFLAVGAGLSFGWATFERRVLMIALVVWLALVFPIPGVTGLLLGAIPKEFFAISSDIAWLRYLPTMVALAVFGGYLGWSGLLERFPRSRFLFGAVSVLGLGWSFAEAEKLVRSGYRNVNTPEIIAAFYRPETVRQFSYIFPGLPVSPYLTNGVVDYRLESRLLRRDDPSREAGEPVDFTGAREVVLRSTVDATSPHWLYLEPKLTLAPLENVLLKFEFFEKNYSGTFIARGPGGFRREYPMPVAGFFAKSFGVESSRPKTIALWNTGEKEQPIELVFLRSELPADGKPFGDFARVKIQPYSPKRLPVETQSLIPYRAKVRATEPVWLETPRAFIPGYRARVGSSEVPVVASPNSMAMIEVPAGESVVELVYRGTSALWLAMGISAASWLALIVLWSRATRGSKPLSS